MLRSDRKAGVNCHPRTVTFKLTHYQKPSRCRLTITHHGLELSDRGSELVSTIYTLIATVKLNGIDPEAWLAGSRTCSAGSTIFPVSRLNELPPWDWPRRPALIAA